MTIIDRWGNAVSMTNTLGTFFGAGVVAEGTGLVLSNGMDWFDIDINIWTGEQPGFARHAARQAQPMDAGAGHAVPGQQTFMLVGAPVRNRRCGASRSRL